MGLGSSIFFRKMKESIVIDSFGPVSHIQINEIKPFTVFIGKSASGKSTIMKVIALLRYIYKLANIRSYFHLSNISRSPFRIDFSALMRSNGLYGMLQSDTHIKYSVLSDSGNEYCIEYSNKKLGKLPDIKVNDLVFLKGVFISENRNAISSWLGNGLGRKSINSDFYFEETLNLFIEATSSMKDTAIPGLGVSLTVSKSNNGQTQYTLHGIEDNTKPFKLKEASSGMKSTIPMAVIAEYMASKFNFKDAYRRSVLDYLLTADRLTEFRPATEFEGFRPMVSVHVEEPELSLDPVSQIEVQSQMVDALFHNALPDRKCLLMYATHSPYLANHINLLMAQWESNHYTGLNPDDVDVFLLNADGTMQSATVYDEANRKVVDSEFLSKAIETLYDNYYRLRND